MVSVLSRAVCPFCDMTVEVVDYCLVRHLSSKSFDCLGSGADVGLLFSHLSI